MQKPNPMDEKSGSCPISLSSSPVGANPLMLEKGSKRFLLDVARGRIFRS